MQLKGIMLVIMAALTAVSTVASAEDFIIKEVAVPIMDVYIPSNLKGDQEGYVVINGLFPNSCYTLNRVDVINSDSFQHQIRPIADVRSGICFRVLVPFNKEVPLGFLKSGIHKLTFVADDGTSYEKEFQLK